MSQILPTPDWDMTKRDRLSIVSARTLARLHQLIKQEYSACHMLVSVWSLPNGYTNLGTYVVGIATPQGGTEYDLVVQHGSTYHTMQHNQPLPHLLSPDGFEVLVEYREHVVGVTITPTHSQMNAFLQRYQQGIEQWIACLQTRLEMPHPHYLGDLEILEEVCALFSQDEQDIHLRGRRYARDLLADHAQCVEHFGHLAHETLLHAHRDARNRLYEWWKESPCVDYAFPPAPLVDHSHPQTLPTFEYQRQVHKKVVTFGQVAVVPVMMECFDRTNPGYDLVDRHSHRQIAVWLPTNTGGKDGACTYAQRLSALTDWPQFDRLTRRQKYGLGVRVRELLQTTVDEYTEQTCASHTASADER